MQYSVKGMTCGHCEAAVTRAIHSIDPAAKVSTDRSANRVSVESGADPAALQRAIVSEGYEAERAS